MARITQSSYRVWVTPTWVDGTKDVSTVIVKLLIFFFLPRMGREVLFLGEEETLGQFSILKYLKILSFLFLKIIGRYVNLAQKYFYSILDKILKQNRLELAG